VLERAVNGLAFETVDAANLSGEDWAGKRLLFAVSADVYGVNEALDALIARMLRKECDLTGSVCAAVLDAVQSGEAHAGLLRLLLAANGAGCMVINRPCVEAGRDMRNVPVMYDGAGGTPFDLYAAAARSLTERLVRVKHAEAGNGRMRLVSALAGKGAARDWRAALEHALADEGGSFADENGEAQETLLLVENTNNIPDEKTLLLLDGPHGGALRCLLASPWFGAEVFCMLALERACLQGTFYLPPDAFTVLEGVSAAEAVLSRRDWEKVRRTLRALCPNPDRGSG
jgi:hypothetical protein